MKHTPKHAKNAMLNVKSFPMANDFLGAKCTVITSPISLRLKDYTALAFGWRLRCMMLWGESLLKVHVISRFARASTGTPTFAPDTPEKVAKS